MGELANVGFIIALFIGFIVPMVIFLTALVAFVGKDLLDIADKWVNSLWLKKTGLRRRK